MTHPAAPPRASRPWLLGAVAVWLVMAWAGSSSAAPAESGPFRGTVRLETDVFEGRYGAWAVGSTEIGRMLVEIEAKASRGDRLGVSGTVDGEPGFAAGHAYGGVLSVRSVETVTPSDFPPHVAGRAVRERVVRGLEPFDDARALLAGFLIGDVSRIAATDVEAMRRSGLAHFVAVSGSNVALFLALVAVAAGPLAAGPRRRALVGLVALPVYAAATGFEPSVMRASVMAGLALAGRLAGVVLEAWQLLAVAVTGLVLYDPALTANVGFQLSVAATSGVLLGARWPTRGVVRRALAISAGAQIAVAPLLIVHFGTVPLFSPVVNLLAAPLVTGATLAGAVGVAGLGFLLSPAALAADMVLTLARGAAGWPQLDAWQLAGVIVVLGLVARFRLLRPAVAVLTSLGALVSLVAPATSLPPGSVVVLDVGQGDAILLAGGDGHFALVDGGPDPSVLRDRLREYGVANLELVVMSHPHADHATGLTALVGQFPIGMVWAEDGAHRTSASTEFFASVAEQGLTARMPSVGEVVRLGSLSLRVAGPVRRYASPNDQSIVLEVSGAGRTMLLSGDIETYAQADLPGLRADVLKVPHQGGATSHPEWLSSVGATLAVISVGPNQFGHPADWVIATLEESGAEVRRTDVSGDVIVDLSREHGP